MSNYPGSNSKSDLRTELLKINASGENELNKLKKCYQTANKALDKLKLSFTANKGLSEQAEIQLFKITKPYILSKVIKYGVLYKFELEHSKLPTDHRIKQYNKFVNCLQLYIRKNNDLYKYYRSNSIINDRLYFTRAQRNAALPTDTALYSVDKDFSTSHDTILATLMAYENIFVYIENQIQQLASGAELPLNEDRFHLQWTANKIDLVEIIYALQASQAINNGNITLKELVEAIEYIFNTNLGDYSRIFYDLQNRSNTTKFLDVLKDALEIKVERALDGK